MKRKNIPAVLFWKNLYKNIFVYLVKDDSYRSGNKPLPEHLAELWDVLTRRPDEQGGTLIPLPYPYIVPGGRFREVYYWDSYFTMLGLQVSKRIDIIENMINNFAYLIDTSDLFQMVTALIISAAHNHLFLH
jgi:neutral trehalase